MFGFNVARGDAALDRENDPHGPAAFSSLERATFA